MARALNIRQQRFAEFVVSGESATQAYISAGYKVSEKVARTNGARMLANAGVKLLIAELRAPQTSKALLTKEEKRDMLAKLARGRLTVNDLVKVLGEDSKLAGHYEPERHVVEDGPERIQSARERAKLIASPFNRMADTKE